MADEDIYDHINMFSGCKDVQLFDTPSSFFFAEKCIFVVPCVLVDYYKKSFYLPLGQVNVINIREIFSSADEFLCTKFDTRMFCTRLFSLRRDLIDA